MLLEIPSWTAYHVALMIMALGAKPGMNDLLPPGSVHATEKLLIACGLLSAGMARQTRSQLLASVYDAFGWILPGQFEAFAYRKSLCEYQVRKGIGAGATQILVLGAGYDTMGWRLGSEYPNVNFVEIDHPATSRLKVKGIGVLGQPDNLRLIAEDLGERRLAEVLNSYAFWDRHAPTVVVAEGVVMYLSSEAVRDLFCQCAAVTGPGSRIVFSFLPMGANGRPDVGPWSELTLCIQDVTGEPWKWCMRLEELSRFLEETGWSISPAHEGTICKRGVEYIAVAAKSTMRASYCHS